MWLSCDWHALWPHDHRQAQMGCLVFNAVSPVATYKVIHTCTDLVASWAAWRCTCVYGVLCLQASGIGQLLVSLLSSYLLHKLLGLKLASECGDLQLILRFLSFCFTLLLLFFSIRLSLPTPTPPFSSISHLLIQVKLVVASQLWLIHYSNRPSLVGVDDITWHHTDALWHHMMPHHWREGAEDGCSSLHSNHTAMVWAWNYGAMTRMEQHQRMWHAVVQLSSLSVSRLS